MGRGVSAGAVNLPATSELRSRLPLVATASTKTPRARRTQAERRAATRGALLDATIDTLIDYGYGGVTTTRVVERAGVSRGAQIHHFPTKAQLVAESVRHLAEKRSEEALKQISKVPEGRGRLEALLDALWKAHSGPLFHASLELWVAARTDPELRKHLLKVEREVTETVWQTAPLVFGKYAEVPDFQTRVETALSAMRGLALLATVTHNKRQIDERWRAMREQLLQLVSA